MDINTTDGPSADPVAVAIRSLHTMATGGRSDFDAVFHPDAVKREDKLQPPSSARTRAGRLPLDRTMVACGLRRIALRNSSRANRRRSSRRELHDERAPRRTVRALLRRR